MLESGTAANGNDRLLLSTENVDGAFWGAAGGRSFGLSAIQWHSGHASMVQIGRLFDDHDTVGDYVGVQLLRDTNDIPFRLAMYENTYDCRIAAFAFDADEMKYNDGTDDLLRIGVFTNPTETYSTTTLASFPSAFTEQTGETHFTGTLTGDDFEITNDGWDGQTQPKWRCPIPTTMAGKTVTLDYDFSWGLADWENSFVYVRVVAVESGTSAELYMFENAYQLTTSQPGASESESFTLPNDISSAYLEVHLYGSGVDTRYGIEPEEVIALNDLSLIYYNKGKTEINDKGLKVYFSPINRIVLTQDEASFNVPLVEANMLKLGAWRIYPEPPSFGASAKLYFRYGSSVKGYLSSSGTGQIN